MFQGNIAKFTLYCLWISGGYFVSRVVTNTADAFASNLDAYCVVDLHSKEILAFSIALGILTGLEVVSFTTKIRRVVVYSTLCYIFLKVYAALLRVANPSQLNLFEILFRTRIPAIMLLCGEYILILITKACVYSLTHEIIRNLYYLIGGTHMVKIVPIPRLRRRTSATKTGASSPKKVRFHSSKDASSTQ